MNLHAKHITARISRHAHPMSVCMTASTLAHTVGPDSTPSSSVIGLLWDRAARWQIWIQGNRKGGMDREGGDKERGAVHYFVPSLSLSLSLCAGSGWKGLHRQGRKHVMRGDDTATETHPHPLWLPSLLLAAAFATAAAAAVSASHRGEREPTIAAIPPPNSHFCLSSSLFHFCLWMMGF